MYKERKMKNLFTKRRNLTEKEVGKYVDDLRDPLIDLVELGGFFIFMYENDLAYKQLGPDVKNMNFDNFDLWGLKSLSTNRHPKNSLFLSVISHFLELKLPVLTIDIGCQYGTSSLSMAAQLDYLGNIEGMGAAKEIQILSFDCGQAGNLASHNVLNNGGSERISFSNKAISSFNGSCLVYSVDGHSEDNRIVNRHIATKTRVVECLTLDTLMNSYKNHGVFLKIDTQGAEYQVLKGLNQSQDENYICMVVEFTPDALKSSIEPSKFLEGLAENYFVYCLDFVFGDTISTLKLNNKVVPIHQEMFRDFSEVVDSSDNKWVDLLCVSKKIPLANLLHERILKS